MGKPNIARWLALPGRAGARTGDQPGQRMLLPAGVVAVAIAVTAATALGIGNHGAKRAAAEPTAQPKSAYLQPVGVLVQRGTVPEPTFEGDKGTVGVPPKTPARPTKPVDLAAGRTAGQYAGRSGTLTPAGIATLAMQRGCSSTQAVIATAVAMAESGGSPSAQGDVSLMTSTWDWSAGLWQIRGLHAQRNTGGLRDSVANQNAVTNSVAMYTISNACTNWVPWSTYNTGAYRAYLGVASQAVDYVVGYYGAHHRYPVVAPPDPNATVPVPASGQYGADPAPAVAAGQGGTAKSSAKSSGKSSAKSSGKSSAKPEPKISSSSSAARSSSAAGGSAGSNTGAGSNGGSSPTAPKSTPAPARSTPTNPVIRPVGAVTSAVGGVTSTVRSVLPSTACVPLVSC